MATMFEKDGKLWIKERNGVEHEAGDMAESEIMPVDPLDEIRAKLDLVVQAKIKDGTLTTDMVAASALAETTKAELTAEIEKATGAAK